MNPISRTYSSSIPYSGDIMSPSPAAPEGRRLEGSSGSHTVSQVLRHTPEDYKLELQQLASEQLSKAKGDLTSSFYQQKILEGDESQ